MCAPGHPPHAQTARPEVKLLKHPLKRRWRLQVLRRRPLQALLMSGADCLERVGCFVRTTSQLFVTAGPAGQKS